MTREEKLQLNRERQKAVREAWAREQNLVRNGQGTVDWDKAQQKELMENGHVKGFEGQHMKSVSTYPEYAESADNIQFLSHEDHLAAHNSGNVNGKNGYHRPTNGYYDSMTQKMHTFGNDPPRRPEPFKLSNPCYKGYDAVKQNNTSTKECSKEAAHTVNSKMSNAQMAGRG